jgi:arylsulfatase A-like enzyme
MKRIRFVLLFTLPLILMPGIRCADPNNKISSEEKPNIIIIMIDNVGYPEIGINGNELVKTPNLDNFASEGTRFERFYSNPLCAPTRASLMTGRYHYRTGVLHTSRGAAKMYGSEVTIAELLKNDGYTTGIFGKWHLGDNYPMRPQDQGFDQTLIHKSGRLGQVPDKPNSYINPKLWENGQYIQKDGYCTDIFFDAAMDFMQKHQHTPFFIYLPTNIAHATSEAGQEVPGKYITPYLENGLEENIAAVCGMIDNFDENFGRLTAKLSSLGLREKTLVIFLSDDGNIRVNKVDFRGHGYATPYEGSIRVPCFVQWPGHFPGKLKVDQIANHIDILPTLLDAAGADTPDNLTIDGVSLLPLLEGKGKDWADRMIFLQCERGMKVHRYKNCAVISERFKLIGYPNTFEERELVTSRQNPVLELYDISSDPGETTNLADLHPDMLKKLRAAYDNWFDDVKNTRQFSPGLIHVGSDAENPVYLCRYQDATYINKKPAGWPLFIERPGKYEVTVNRGESLEEGKLIVQFDSTFAVQPLSQGKDKAVFSFPEGKVIFNAWVMEGEKEYTPRPNEDKIGDVLIRRIPATPQ